MDWRNRKLPRLQLHFRVAQATHLSWEAMGETVNWGKYNCRRCSTEYIVNDGTWRLCSPELCHDCVEYLETLHAAIPVDRDGNETKQ